MWRATIATGFMGNDQVDCLCRWVVGHQNAGRKIVGPLFGPAVVRGLLYWGLVIVVSNSGLPEQAV